jgi:hypothetical protein
VKSDPVLFGKKWLDLQLPAETNKKGRKRYALSPFVLQHELLFTPCGPFSTPQLRSRLLARQYSFLIHYFHS